MKKRIVSLLLALVLLASLISASAISESTDEHPIVLRYNLHALQNGPYGSNGYAPSQITSIWQTAYGHSQNVASLYYEKCLETPPTDGGPALGPYANQYTDPFCFVGLLNPSTGASIRWGDKAYGWTYEDPNQVGDGWVMKILVPSSDTYTVETNFRTSYGKFAESVEVYFLPADGTYTMAEVLNAGNTTAALKEAGRYAGSTGIIGGYYDSNTNDSNALQVVAGNDNMVELDAGEYYVCYRAPYRGFMGGSLTLRGLFEQDEISLIPDADLLNEDGALELSPGETKTIELTAMGSMSGAFDLRFAEISNARADTLSDAVTAELDRGFLTVTASPTAPVGETVSATVLMVIDNMTAAWKEIPIAFVQGETSVLTLSSSDFDGTLTAFRPETLTLSAKIDGEDASVTEAALTDYTFTVTDKAGAVTDAVTVSVDQFTEDGKVSLKLDPKQAGEYTLSVRATLSGAVTASPFELPFTVESEKLVFNLHRLQYGQWSGAGYFHPISYATTWGWENSLANFYNYTTEPWIYYPGVLSEGSDISTVDKSTQNYGAKLTLVKGDKLTIAVKVQKAGNYNLLQTVQTISSNMGASRNCGYYDIWFAPEGVDNPTADKYKLTAFRNYAPESTILAQDKVYYSGTTPYAANMSTDVGDVTVGEGVYLLTVSPRETNGGASYTPTLYWSNSALEVNGKEWIELSGGSFTVAPNSATALATFDPENEHRITVLSGTATAEVDENGVFTVTTAGEGVSSILVEAENETASGAAFFHITAHESDLRLSTVDGAQIRTTAPQGLRFISSIEKSGVDFETVTEFGTVMIPTANLTDIDELRIGATVGGLAVAKVPANVYYAEDETSITFTAVVTNIQPKHFKRSITARAYAILEDGTVIYGATYTARSPYQVAENGLASEHATDEEKALFEAIINAAQ